MVIDAGADAQDPEFERGRLRQSLGDEGAMREINSAIEALLYQSRDQVSQSQAPGGAAGHVGRPSQIAGDDEMQGLREMLPGAARTFRYVVQFQAQTDGVRLSNMYRSYERAEAAPGQAGPVEVQDAERYNLQLDYSKMLLSND